MLNTSVHGSFSNVTDRHRFIIRRLYDIGALKFGNFLIKSGIQSPVYIDLRLTVSDPELLKEISSVLLEKTKELPHDLLCGVPYTAIPFATAMTLSSGKPMLFRRKEAKAHGTKRIIEGNFKPNERVLVVEDLVTSGISVMETVDPLRTEQLHVEHVVVLLDRQQGAAENLKQHNITLHAAFTLSDMLSVLVSDGKIDSSVRDSVAKFVAENQVRHRSPVSPMMSVKNSSPMPEESNGSTSEKPHLKPLTYAERAKSAQHPVARRLFQLMEAKRSNLAVAADVTASAELLELAESIGPHIVMLKTHADIVNDWTAATANALQELASRHNFLLFEDRKIADIGSTAFQQVSGGLHRIADWADVVNAHAVSGPGVIAGLAKAVDSADEHNWRRFGILLIAQMSSKGNLAASLPDYTKKTIEMAAAHSNHVFGFICQGKIAGDNFIYLTPGVNMAKSEDNLGQGYMSPETIIADKGSDIIIVGRGIYQDNNKTAAAKTYQEAGWSAYEKRCSKTR